MLWCLVKPIPSSSFNTKAFILLAAENLRDRYLIATHPSGDWSSLKATRTSCPILSPGSSSYPLTIEEHSVPVDSVKLRQHCCLSQQCWLPIFPVGCLRPLSWLHCRLIPPSAYSGFFQSTQGCTLETLHSPCVPIPIGDSASHEINVGQLSSLCKCILGHKILQPINIIIQNNWRAKNC